MGAFRNLLDGLLSFVAFALTVAVFAGPAWATYIAVTAGLVPAWVYVPLAATLYIGANLAIAFLRKALDGVSPLRTYKRK